MTLIHYPTPERIIEYNLLALAVLKAKKADRPAVLSKPKLFGIVDACKDKEGDIYDKAVVLLQGIVKQHPFASGNRRTAVIVVKDFLLENGEKLAVKDDPTQARVLLGIREDFYTTEETKDWLKHGRIREFKR